MARPLLVGIDLYPMQTDWPSIRDAVGIAERVGIDWISTWDHLYGTDDPSHRIFEGWSLIAAIGALTTQAQVGLLVGANTFRNPGLTAKAAVTVDHITDGRCVLGLGAGWRPREHVDHGIPFGSGPGERLTWLEESVEAVRGLLAGRVVSSPPDGHYAFDRARHQPAPVHGPATLPLLIGGGGERRTLRIVARHADIWHHRGSADALAHKLDVLRRHCDDVGRDPDSIDLAFDTYVVIRDDPAEARRVLLDGLARNDETWEPDDVSAWLGPPEFVADRWSAYADLGFRRLIVSLPAPYDRETIERLPIARNLLAPAD